MGTPMVANLLRAGFQVVGHSRSKKTPGVLALKGFHLVTSPRQVGEQCHTVILMLPSSVETKQVLFERHGLVATLRRGSTIIDMSTSNPAETVRIGSRLKGRGIQLLDAPVSRGVAGAKSGTLTVMVGGNKAVFQRQLPILRAMGKEIVYFGRLGSGLYVKTLNNFLLAVNLFANLHGISLLRSKQINIGAALRMIGMSSGESWVISKYLLPNLGKKKPAVGFYLKHLAKDVRIYDSLIRTKHPLHILTRPLRQFWDAMGVRSGEEDILFPFTRLLDSTSRK